ncbi:hypothetical protein [Psychromicrobium lacuslunae]|uniref:Uncharacterized protein n=1 Tax=Psychromicrobium lacuslunae TaxID=1618207 RepID=A0A0D4BZN0_9MICC|nr:hypothetical protein [Psychromicrobium lacuslunae]AJT41783.1 hypothetical protein UM93_10105 [Psychromicrobium lacuslunae]
MSTTLTALPVVETAPGKIMPEALISLDFKANGPLVTPATMGDDGVTVTLCSSTSIQTRPTKD